VTDIIQLLGQLYCYQRELELKKLLHSIMIEDFSELYLCFVSIVGAVAACLTQEIRDTNCSHN
jgi:hypothetical protein